MVQPVDQLCFKPLLGTNLVALVNGEYSFWLRSDGNDLPYRERTIEFLQSLANMMRSPFVQTSQEAAFAECFQLTLQSLYDASCSKTALQFPSVQRFFEVVSDPEKKSEAMMNELFKKLLTAPLRLAFP